MVIVIISKEINNYALYVLFFKYAMSVIAPDLGCNVRVKGYA